MDSTTTPVNTELDDMLGGFVRPTPAPWRRWVLLVVVGLLAVIAVPTATSPSISPHIEAWGANPDGSGHLDLMVSNNGRLPIEVRGITIASRGVAVDRTSSLPLRVAPSEAKELHVRLRFTDCARLDRYLHQFDLAVAVMPLGIIRHTIVTAGIPQEAGPPADGFLVMTSAVACPNPA